MSSRRDDDLQLADEIQKSLPPELSLLFSAIRSEFDAKLNAAQSRLLMKLSLMGIPLGAAGGFVAEYMRPGVADTAVAFVMGIVS